MTYQTVYPSIGGWTLSSSFPAVAADPKKRTRFARECVGLIADYGFDGIVRLEVILSSSVAPIL
jgi:GH18 family chitinase